MIFTSLDFAIFLPIVFFFYWFVFSSNLKLQNLCILFASFFFYGWWDYRFLFLIIISSLVDYYIGLKLYQSNQNQKRFFVWISLCFNIGLLGFFKYYNFFYDSFVDVFKLLGKDINGGSLKIILPLGISFYTFQKLSYVIDIYKQKLKPCNNIIVFFAFVSFFPQLVAGPIERATNLLHQFEFKRQFSYIKSIDGLKQILWGFFKKLVIADNCAVLVDMIFGNYTAHTSSTLVLGALLFSFQIYCDFSGYTDIAIGTSRLFGFNLRKNFNYPYFSKNITEFWQRWHISLTTWFRDYLYFPLGGNKKGKWTTCRNTLIVFLVSGLWHGANWTFVIWGALNWLLYLPHLFLRKTNKVTKKVRKLPNIQDLILMIMTFIAITFSWIFFRSESLVDAVHYICGIFSRSFFSIPCNIPKNNTIVVVLLIMFFMIMEWLGRDHEYAIERYSIALPGLLSWFFYSSIILLLVLYGYTQVTPFIYFQF